MSSKQSFARSVSWKKYISGVKNQKKCNSCYIASTFSAVEIMHAKKYDEYISLAMQEIIDCCRENSSCQGGQPSNVADYLMNYGISTEENYPYRAKKRSCRAKYYHNKHKRKSKKRRILEQLLSESAHEGPRLLQSSRYDRPRYVAKYDDQRERFYYEVHYMDGSVRYEDLNKNPYRPSHVYSSKGYFSSSGRSNE